MDGAGAGLPDEGTNGEGAAPGRSRGGWGRGGEREGRGGDGAWGAGQPSQTLLGTTGGERDPSGTGAP